MEALAENKTPQAVKPVSAFRPKGGQAFFVPATSPRFFSPPATIQRKLSVGSPGDHYEQEADAMADRIMRMSGGARSHQAAPGGQPSPRRSVTPLVQAKAVSSQVPVPAALSESLSSSKSRGSTLEPSTHDFMSDRFGADFSQVRIHADAEASQLSNALNAKAFTTENHIYFNQGQYRPETNPGKQLLAHELTHVLQQGGTDDPGYIQRTVLNIGDFDLTQTVDPVAAVSDVEYIDNGIIDWTMRSDGSVMNPTFTAFTLFYEDGTIFDIPASSNSYFPNLANPRGQTVTLYLRHNPTGRIFPVTYDTNDFLAASNPTDIRTIPNPQFLFLRRAGGTPNIITAYDNEIARLAFAYSGLIAQLWNVGLGVRGAVQIFQLSGALRAAAVARTGASGASVAGRLGTGVLGAGTSGAMSRIIAITVNVIRRAAGLAPAELTAIQQAEARINLLLQEAINNVNAGTATGAWAQRLATTSATGPTYRMVLGNAIHEETFNLIQQDVASGALPAGIRTNIGRAAGSGLTNSFGRLRPDIRLPLGTGREAIFDITTTGQAGHASKYASYGFVEYISELLY